MLKQRHVLQCAVQTWVADMGELSVVIPTMNAAAMLRRSLPPLAEMAAVGLIRDVVLADGGSSDRTAEIAEASGAVFVSTPLGRGPQLAAGAEAARGSWLMFLHADTVLPEDWEATVTAFIADPMNVERAGYFQFRLDEQSAGARRVERLVRWRCRVFGLPYGDQGLIMSRQLYRKLGGFRSIPLMEDVDLVRRIGRRRLVPLAGAATTSAERYRRDGYLLRPVRNLCCLTLYLLGVPPRTIAKLYG